MRNRRQKEEQEVKEEGEGRSNLNFLLNCVDLPVVAKMSKIQNI